MWVVNIEQQVIGVTLAIGQIVLALGVYVYMRLYPYKLTPSKEDLGYLIILLSVSTFIFILNVI